MPSNVELWNAWIKENPTYRSRISMSAQEVMTERGFSEIARSCPNAIIDFMNASVVWTLNIIMPSRARSWWDRYDVQEKFYEPNGGMVQRLYGETALEVDPGYLNMKQGDAKSPWITHRPEGAQAIFEMNDNYQGLLTLTRWKMAMAFANPTGISRYAAAQLQGLENSYVLHEDAVLDEVLSTMLSDPILANTQIVEVPDTIWDDKDAIVKFFALVDTVITAMKSESQSGAWNMLGFTTVQDASRLRLIVRPDLVSGMRWYARPVAFNADNYALDVPICPKSNFGGITYVAKEAIGEVAAGTSLYACVSADELRTKIPAPEGHRGIGLSNVEGSSDPITYSGDSNVGIVDPHADTYATLIDKGTIFSTIKNPYRVTPWGPNPRTLEINYWANAENNGRHYDRRYTCVKFVRQGSVTARAARSRSKAIK